MLRERLSRFRQTFAAATVPHLGKLYLAYAALFLAVSAAVPPVNDYRAYLLQWRAVAQGQDPWLTPILLGVNAYGPLHNLYGLLSLADASLPRLLGSALWLLAGWLIVSPIRASAQGRHTWLALVIALNPFFWGWVAVFGSNDAIVAAFVVFAALALSRRSSVGAGVLIGLAALLKFYPLLVVPYVAVHRRRLDVSFALAAAGVFAAGMALSAAFWGSSTLAPLLFVSGREPSQLSLQAFLATSALSPLHGAGVPIWLSQAAFVVAEVAIFGLHALRGGTRREGLLLGLLVPLTFYPLGHVQFYLPLLLVVVLALASDIGSRVTARSLITLLAIVSAFATCYLAFGGLLVPPWLWIRQNAGLPTFVVEIAVISSMLAAQARRAR